MKPRHGSNLRQTQEYTDLTWLGGEETFSQSVIHIWNETALAFVVE